MELTTSKKKIMLATILSTGLALAISQSALAQPTAPELEGKKGTPPCQYQLDPATQKAHDKFLSETVAMRKEMVEKNAALRALLNAGTPDTAKASQLAGELFELREKMRAKAKEAGLPMLMMGQDDMSGMPCQGMGMGMGMGRRHHRN
ncbi:MAG: periplasmic heavy metal sensor [Desulfobulbaceae bacterium]|nr:periplasmic heavy metal sensor [Desulfobulbaceae bacterium]